MLALLPLFALEICLGMSNGFPAILIAQLSEPCSEFNIMTHEKSLIVSIDNVAAPLTAILGGLLQQKTGPKKTLMLCRDCSHGISLL